MCETETQNNRVGYGLGYIAGHHLLTLMQFLVFNQPVAAHVLPVLWIYGRVEWVDGIHIQAVCEGGWERG